MTWPTKKRYKNGLAVITQHNTHIDRILDRKENGFAKKIYFELLRLINIHYKLRYTKVHFKVILDLTRVMMASIFVN